MELDFYTKKLAEAGITALVPDKDERIFIQRTIDTELLRGVFLPESRKRFVEIMQKLRSQGAEGVVLGCTEIPLLIKEEDVDFPLFNTTVMIKRSIFGFGTHHKENFTEPSYELDGSLLTKPSPSPLTPR
jgi:aspartate racemase